jgi:hypothetical protein
MPTIILILHPIHHSDSVQKNIYNCKGITINSAFTFIIKEG